MFGQMPVEALKQNAIAENELDKSNAINAHGANLYSQDFNMAQQKDQNYYQQINKLSASLVHNVYFSEPMQLNYFKQFNVLSPTTKRRFSSMFS